MSPHETSSDVLDELFDETYWRAVEQTCEHCGQRIKRYAGSATGWTHAVGRDDWGGIRCTGLLTVATPMGDDEQ